MMNQNQNSDRILIPKKYPTTIKRKLFYNGKMAPKGSIHLVLRVEYPNKGICEGCVCVVGGLGPEKEKEITDDLYNEIIKRFKERK